MSTHSPRSPRLYVIGGTAAQVSRAVRERHERTQGSSQGARLAQERAIALADQLAYSSARRLVSEFSAGKMKRPPVAAVEAFRRYWAAFLTATHNQEYISDATRLRLRELAAHADRVARDVATSANTNTKASTNTSAKR